MPTLPSAFSTVSLKEVESTPLITDAFPWKTTLGPIENRPGHNGSWGYRASDGLGLLEFLQWCQDMGSEPLLAVYAGYSLEGGHIDAGPLLKSYVDDALDEIEYIIGDKSTYWGAKRAEDGHPEPFKLTYVEIGNEDWFDRSNSYDGRFNQFRTAIEAKYPQLTCISTIADAQFPKIKVTSGKPPAVVDEHYYRNSWDMWENASQYDKYDRNGPKIFVGEWATREGVPATNLNAALGDAAWMTGMERNSDLIIMSCYAPLLVNVSKDSSSKRAWQWDSDLIGYDALNSYGSPSYYVQKLFNQYLGNKIVPTTFANMPTQDKPLTKRDSAQGITTSKKVPTIFYSATMNDINELTEAMLVILEADGFAGGGINFDAKIRRNSTDPADLFYAHIGGMDAFARALITADNILNKSDYKKLRTDRYASFDGGKGKEFEDGKLSLEDLRNFAVENGEPKTISGKQDK